MLITPNNSYVYVSLASLGVQILTLGSGGVLSAGSVASILRHLALRPARQIMAWRVTRVPAFFLWASSTLDYGF